MEELGSHWSYQENIDELKQKLLYATLELESFKTEANEEIRKNKENVKNLLNLLKMAYQERDEAREQLQKLMNDMPNVLPQIQPESPLNRPTMANSGLTESESLYEAYNRQSHGSSPVDSFFDGVSSPDFSNVHLTDSSSLAFAAKQPLASEYSGSSAMNLATSGAVKSDPASAVIDYLVKGKTLPEKGKLLRAVTEAGPLLQTLLVAGPLPRWRIPPPPQAFRIPPVSIQGSETSINEKITAKPSYTSHKLLHSLSHAEMSRGSSQLCSASMLNFASGPSGPCSNNALLFSAGASLNSQILAGKPHRFQ